MNAGWLILIALGLFLAVLLIRAARFRPARTAEVAPVAAEADAEAAAHALSELVRCKTVSHPDHEGDDEAEFERLIDSLPALFPKFHAACERERIAPRSLVYRWKGKTPENPLVLTSHFDVVPADPAVWGTDPFSGEIKDGMIYGRGTLDTKGTLAAALSAAETLLAEGFAPERDIWFCFAGDEEVMGGGAVKNAEALEKRGVRPLCVVDEGGAIVENVFPGVKTPCALIGIAEKGMANYRLSVAARGGHSSAPLANTPVDMLARACLTVRKKAFPFRVTQAAGQMIDRLARHSTFAYRLIFANLWAFKPLLNALCKKTGGELNALFRTTTAFTVFRSGDAANVLPTGAELNVNVRLLPGETLEGTLAALRRKVGDPRVEVSLTRGQEPSACSGTDGAGYAALARSISETYPGVLVSPYLMIAGSDARHYERICGHVFRFSGMPLSAEERKLIHGVGERIPVATLVDTVRFYRRLIINACGKA